MDLDVRMKAVLLGAVILIVSEIDIIKNLNFELEFLTKTIAILFRIFFVIKVTYIFSVNLYNCAQKNLKKSKFIVDFRRFCFLSSKSMVLSQSR